MITKPFKALHAKVNSLNDCHAVSGPGEYMPIMFDSWVSALNATFIANNAYCLGYKHAQADILKALGWKQNSGV